MNSAELIGILEKDGLKRVGVRGSHHKYRHPDGRMTIVPHPEKDLGAGLVNKIPRTDAKVEEEGICTSRPHYLSKREKPTA